MRIAEHIGHRRAIFGLIGLLTLGRLAPAALEAQLPEDFDTESFSEGRAADPVFITGKLESFATRTANQVFQLNSAGVLPDMSLDVDLKHASKLVIRFCARFYSNSNLSIVRLKARVNGVGAEPSTVHVVPVANFSGTGKHQLRCFTWAKANNPKGTHTVEVHNNPTGTALIYERSLTVLAAAPNLEIFSDRFETGNLARWSE